MDDKENPGYPGVLQSIGLMLLLFLFTLVGVMMSMFFGLEENLMMTFAYILGMGATIALAMQFKQKAEGQISFSFQVQDWAILVVAVFCALLVGVVLDPLSELLPEPESLLTAIRKMMEKPFIALLGIVIAPAILEEMLFRGIILDGLNKRFGFWPSLIGSSILFGAVHLNWTQFLGASVLGLLLGWIYLRTKSLLYPILLHAINNGIAWTLLYMGYEKITLVDFFQDTLTYYVFVGLSSITLIIAIFYLNKLFTRIGTA